MNRKYHKIFLKFIKKHLLSLGCSIIVDNNHAIVYDMGIEHMVVPKKIENGVMEVHMYRDYKKRDTFLCGKKYVEDAKKMFLKFLDLTQYRMLNQYDKI